MREKEDIKPHTPMRHSRKAREWRKKCESGVERSDLYMHEVEDDSIFNPEVLLSPQIPSVLPYLS